MRYDDMTDTQVIRMSSNGSAKVAREIVTACTKDFVPEDVAQAARKAGERFYRHMMLEIEREIARQTMKSA